MQVCESETDCTEAEEESVRNMESYAESDVPLYGSVHSSAVSTGLQGESGDVLL